MTRLEAARTGARFFDTKPCKHDQDTRRYTATGRCVTCSARSNAKNQRAIAEAIKAGKIQA